MNSTLILFKEIGRQLFDRWSGTGEPANGNPHPLETAASAARLLLCGNKTLLAALGDRTRTVCILIFIACVLFFVLCWTIRYIRQKREEQIMAEFFVTPLHKGPEARRIQNTGISVNVHKKRVPVWDTFLIIWNRTLTNACEDS